ncbi:lipase secretion chaperone [Stutzerimonas stutzeri]
MKILFPLFVLVVGVSLVVLDQDSDRPLIDQPAAEAGAAPNAATTKHEGETPPAPGPELARLPASLSGTRVDGTLRTNSSGKLLVDREVRQVFDYFLSTFGEEPLKTSVARLRQHLETQLAQPARGQAFDLLGRYLDYRRQLLVLEQTHPLKADLEGLRSRLHAAQQLRETLFSEEARRAFFADEEALDRFTLQRLAIRHDPQLDAAAKGEALDQLKRSLPPAMLDALTPAMHLELNQQTQALRATGGSPEALRALRQQLVGNEATRRLEKLDLERQAWRTRLAGYQQEKARIERSRGLSQADKHTAITLLARERFDETERLRLAASEQRIAQKRH